MIRCDFMSEAERSNSLEAIRLKRVVTRRRKTFQDRPRALFLTEAPLWRVKSVAESGDVKSDDMSVAHKRVIPGTETTKNERMEWR